MDDTLIKNINDRVKPGDTLYILGDFSFRGGDPAKYRARINCKQVHLILGNHDPQSKTGVPKADFVKLWTSVNSLLRIMIDKQKIVLCHYAMRVWQGSHRGTWQLYGHSHGNLPDDPHAKSYDVGVDPNGYAPVSLKEIAAIMEKKVFVPIDHHKENVDE